MTIASSSRVRHGASVVVAAMLTLLAQPSASQVAGAPHFPTSLSPAGGTEAARGGLRTIAWNQLIAAGPTVRPNPTYFVICLKPYLENGLAPSCGPNDATWTESVNNPSPALTRNGSRFVFDPPRGLTAEELDRPLRLSVGACFLFTCSYASTALWYSTKNVFAARPVPAASTQSDWMIDVLADNQGSTAIARYSGQLAYWEVLTEVWQGSVACAVNVDAPTYRDDPTIWTIDERGTLLPITQLPRVDDRHVGIPIVGLMRLGAPYGQRAFVTNATALPPGEIVDVWIARVALPIPDSGRRRAYVVVARHDTTNVIREYDESDNTRARCMLR